MRVPVPPSPHLGGELTMPMWVPWKPGNPGQQGQPKGGRVSDREAVAKAVQARRKGAFKELKQKRDSGKLTDAEYQKLLRKLR